MFNDLNIPSSVSRKLESPIHGTTDTLPISRREHVFKQHLRWALHTRWCVSATRRRKICNDPRCKQLRPVIDHIKTCKDSGVCDMPYCAITKECLAHFDFCIDDDCRKCKPMKYAFFGRFLPDVEIYPQPYFHFLSKNERSSSIRQIIQTFYPNPDFTDLQDERMEKEIFRARVIEALSIENSSSVEEYNMRIKKEIRKIRCISMP
ncbi:hypothetical protein Aperf_G00000096337 [Anoplocephala perfoliata]